MELEEWIAHPARLNGIRECNTFEEWKEREPDKMFHNYVRLERAFWTAKNFPKFAGYKTLHYPKLLLASDFFSRIWLVKKTRQESINDGRLNRREEGIFIHQDYHARHYKEDLLNYKEAEKQYSMWSKFHCNLMPGIEPDVFESIGAIEILYREEGWLLIAKSSTHIGGDWLSLVQWDIKLNEEFFYERQIKTA